ncbi:MAG: Indole-3-glycerol phosphate synthase, partial [Trebouxia sp. A1-2]
LDSRRTLAQADDAAKDASDSQSRANALTGTIKRKQKQVADLLQVLGVETLEDRLQSATASPAIPSHRFAQLIQVTALCKLFCAPQDSIPHGKPVLVAEVCRPSPSSSSQDVAKLAADYVAWGVDAIAVATDLEETPAGLSDLFAVCRAVKVPVLQWDWFLHPLQVAEAKEAGAAGIIGVIANVLGNGSPIMSSFAAAIGLDAPVEVVNKTELTRLGDAGVPFFGINLSVGLSLALPGFQTDMAKGLLNNMPFGAITMVGAKSPADARKARLAGADAILLKKEMLVGSGQDAQDVRQMLDQLIDSLNGDD